MEQIRRFTVAQGQLVQRADDDGEDLINKTFTGHAAVFDSPTLIGSKRFGFVETIGRNAFDDVLDNDVRFLINHDGMPLARTTNGTLRLSTDKVGLLSEADLAPTTEGRDLAVLLDRGDVTQMSFAFTVAEQVVGVYESDDELDGMDMRTVTRVGQLFDVSAVTYPAFEETDAGLRSIHIPEMEVRAVLEGIRDIPATNDAYAEELYARQQQLRGSWRSK